MPSISVPLKGAKGWDELMARRKTFWRKDGNNQLTKTSKRPSSTATTGARPRRPPGPRWSNSARRTSNP